MFVPRISFVVAVVSWLCICITAIPGGTIRGADPLAGSDSVQGPDLQKLSLKHGVEVELYGNGLYYFPPLELKVSWDDAKRICESVGMNSLYLDTPEEYDWINLALYAKKRWDVHHWTSGKKDGKWIWDATMMRSMISVGIQATLVL